MSLFGSGLGFLKLEKWQIARAEKLAAKKLNKEAEVAATTQATTPTSPEKKDSKKKG